MVLSQPVQDALRVTLELFSPMPQNGSDHGPRAGTLFQATAVVPTTTEPRSIRSWQMKLLPWRCVTRRGPDPLSLTQGK